MAYRLRARRRHARAPAEEKLCRYEAPHDGADSWTHVARMPHIGAYWRPWSLRSLMPRGSAWRVAQFDTLRLRLASHDAQSALSAIAASRDVSDSTPEP